MVKNLNSVISNSYIPLMMILHVKALPSAERWG